MTKVRVGKSKHRTILVKHTLKQEVLVLQKPLKVDIYVCIKDKVIPYETLTCEEKRALAIRLNRRGLQAAARVEGYELEFFDPPKMDSDVD